MWHSDKILAKAVERTGMSVAEIQKSPWSSLEKKMDIKEFSTGRTVNRRGHNSHGMPKVTREMFDEDERIVMTILEK